MREVAARAGVSTATVSRTFAGGAPIREETRERVLRAARDLEYRPNAAARCLVRGGGRTLALVAPDLARPEGADLIAAVARRAAETGFALAVADAADETRAELEACEDLALRADGLILCASTLGADEIRSLARRLPTVSLLRRVDGVASVTTNPASSLRRSLEHLRELGHRAVTIVLEDDAAPGTLESALRTAGDVRVTTLRGRGFPSGRRLAREIVRDDPPIREGRDTAVVAFDAELAFGLLSGLASSGIEVPGRMSILAASDSPFAAWSHPALTTVAADDGRLGATAADLLLSITGRRRDDRAPLRTVRLEPRVRIRGSTGPRPE